MKILVYNIAYGTGIRGGVRDNLTKDWRYLLKDSPRAIQGIIATLRRQKADVVCLIEMDAGSLRNRFRSQAKTIAEALGYPFFWSFCKYGSRSPIRKIPVLRRHHAAIISRIPGAAKAHYLRHGIKKLVVELIANGLSVFTVHLGLLSAKTRAKQLEEVGHLLKVCERPHVVCGDFNCLRGLDEIRPFVLQNRLTLAHTKPTFPSRKPTKVLDLILASPSVKVVKSGVGRVRYSDHLPVWVEIDTDR